jgi:hypothetical protein
MTGQVRRVAFAVSLLALGLPGCLSFVNHCPKPANETRDQCKELPLTACQNVYVVLVNGVDPLCLGNLKGLRDYLGSLGFTKTYYAQFYHEHCLLAELRQVHQEHPEARFAIVGFEYGASPADKLARKAVDEGLPIDLLVYLQPKMLSAEAGTASTAHRAITIQTGADEANPSNLSANETVGVSCFSRYGVPTHPKTLQLLANELVHLAANIPVNEPIYNAFPTILDDPAPSPRPIVVRKNQNPDEWDFLKPVSRRGIRIIDESAAETNVPRNDEK